VTSRFEKLRRRLDAWGVAPAAAVGVAAGTAAAGLLLVEPTPLRVAVALGLAVVPLPLAMSARMATEAVPRRKARVPPLLDMVRIPGGSFWMGSRDDDPRAYPDEKRRHRVEVAPAARGEARAEPF